MMDHGFIHDQTKVTKLMPQTVMQLAKGQNTAISKENLNDRAPSLSEVLFEYNFCSMLFWEQHKIIYLGG